MRHKESTLPIVLCGIMVIGIANVYGVDLSDLRFDNKPEIYLEKGKSRCTGPVAVSTEENFKKALEEAGAIIHSSDDISGIPEKSWGMIMTVTGCYLDTSEPVPESLGIGSTSVTKASVTFNVKVQYNKQTIYWKQYANAVYGSRNSRSILVSMRSVSLIPIKTCLEDLIGLLRPSKNLVTKEQGKKEG